MDNKKPKHRVVFGTLEYPDGTVRGAYCDVEPLPERNSQQQSQQQ